MTDLYMFYHLKPLIPMKKILFALCATAGLAFSSHAQVSYGLKAGLNVPTFTISSGNVSFTSDASTSFHITGYVDAPIARNFSFQPGLSVQGKGGKIGRDLIDGDFDDITLNLMYLEIPANFVYYIPTGHSGDLFVGAGPYAAYALSLRARMGSVSEKGNFEENGLKRFDAGVNFLLGYKLYNGLLFNAGYALGLANITEENNVSWKNRAWQFGVGFQF